MGTRERRRREFSEREQRILDAAQQLIRSDGLLNLQMSRLAEASEYAVGTLYQHFARKEDLLVALCTRQMRSRVALFERAADWAGPTRERLLAVALVEIATMQQCPDVFRLEQYVFTEVVWAAASSDRRQDCLDVSTPIGTIVSRIATEAVERGELPDLVDMSPLETTIGTWSQCLGMHTLTHAVGLLEQFSIADPYRLLFKHLNYLLNGYGWQPLMASVDDATVQAQMQRLSEEIFGQLLPCPTPVTAASTDFSPIQRPSP